MRAATIAGLVFVGPAMGVRPGRQLTTEPKFKPRVVAPKLEVQQARQALQESLAEKQAFWKAEIERWGMDGLAESLVELLERMGINV